MKQLRLYTGGHKFHNEDFTHLQEGVVETLSSTIQALTGVNFLTRLRGTVLTDTGGSLYTWTEGWWFYVNNIYYMPENVTPTLLTGKSFSIIEVAEANNPVTYRDGSNNNVHITNTFNLLNDLTGAFAATALLQNGTDTGQQARDLNRLILNNLLNNYDLGDNLNEQGWTAATSGFTYASGISSNASYPVEYRKIGNMVEFRGILDNTNTADNPILFSVFPASLRPTVIKRVSVGVTSGGDQVGAFNITTGTDNVNANYQAGGTTSNIILDGVKYYV